MPPVIITEQLLPQGLISWGQTEGPALALEDDEAVSDVLVLDVLVPEGVSLVSDPDVVDARDELLAGSTQMKEGLPLPSATGQKLAGRANRERDAVSPFAAARAIPSDHRRALRTSGAIGHRRKKLHIAAVTRSGRSHGKEST